MRFNRLVQGAVLAAVLLLSAQYLGAQACHFRTGNPVAFAVAGQNQSAAYVQMYVLTDMSGIIQLSTAALPFVGVGEGQYIAYGVNYLDSGNLPVLAAGTPISAIGGDCVDVSNGLLIGVCDCNSPDGNVSFNLSGNNANAAYEQSFALTDDAGIILSIAATPSFAGLGDGVYNMYSVNYEAASTINNYAPGNFIHALSGSCFDISNPLGFVVCTTDADGDGIPDYVEINNGTSPNDPCDPPQPPGYTGYDPSNPIWAAADCDADGEPNGIEHNAGTDPYDPNSNQAGNCNNTTGNLAFSLGGNNTGAAFTQSYALTDLLGEILAISALPAFNGLTDGVYNVYSLNYETALGIDNYEVGNNISDISGDCFDLSGPLSFTVCLDPCAVSSITGEELYTGCEGDGYSVSVNGTLYDESNPTGTETLTAANGCDSVVTVTLAFQPHASGEELYTGCEGDGYSVTVNGTLYDESNPTGTETLTAANGCDSVVTVTLAFQPHASGEELYTGCEGDGYNVTVNGTLYNESNPTGTETLTASSGCDSVVTINLSFLEQLTGEELYTGCEGDGYSVTVNGTLYDESNPTGTETLTAASGCDSVVTVTLTFQPNATGEELYTGCEGDGYSVTVNGTLYNESNPTGTETLTASNGCDSVVTINLSFLEQLTGEELYTGCEGDGYSVTVNGTLYNESNPTGTETLTASSGCDSVVTITLTFQPNATGEELYTGCEGDGYSVTVNGTLYDETNPIGTETLTAANGCDSVVTINLSFLEQPTGEELYTGCEGDGYSVTVNGTVYDESNPTGTETLTASSGCDSVVTINLSFLEQLTGEERYTGCEGDGYSITVNGTLYDESNPTGTETLTASSGCDSVVTITLDFQPNATGEELYTGCEGDGYSVTVNGTVYDESNPLGTETLTASNGCDSVVTVTLTFQPNATGEELYTGCEGDSYSVTVNGTLYNESNPSGTETLTAASGCDSVVTITLTFQPNATGEELYTGCEGDGYSVTVNGTLYDESNPTGTETLTAATGCDSVVTINLSFLEQLTGEELYTGCEGDGYSVTVNGTLYDESNPTGTETLTASNGCDSVVTVNLMFLQQLTGEELYTGCEGDGYSVTVNGTVYDESNPTGTETLTAASGCDSVVTITLDFQPNAIGEELYTGCEGDGYSVTVNGTLYDESNPTGTETLTAANGCDSVVTINLSFLEQLTGEELYTGCEGDGYSVTVNGTLYDESNPTGTETLTAANGCDSVVTINLSFLEQLTGEELYTGCEGDGYSVTVNGTLYDESNPTGTETLTAATGCDSVVTINLSFLDQLTGEELYTGCEGDGYSVTVNGTLYDESNPTGTETLTASNGCDSVVTINLSFLQQLTGEELYTGCEGDGYSVTVNGTLYDESNPTGTETLTATNGCDSVVTINLSFLEQLTGEELYTGCEGDGYSVTVNGTLYDESNPTGTETLTAANGCDSVVTINLSFLEQLTGEELYTGCEGDGYSVTVNGTLYDESNPTGTETLTASTGCDSVVTINLTFQPNAMGEELYTGCEGDGYSVTVNGTLYDESNPTGTETLTAASGCDSVVTINLSFLEQLTGEEFYTGCQGDGYSVTINGTLYDESNPTGTETLTAANGCDSVVTINLSFLEQLTGEELYTGCEGDGYSVTVNGTVYDETNPTGTETLTAANGCDSVVTINLSFLEQLTGEELYTGCEGDGYSVTVNGTLYDESNPTGTETLTAANGCDSVVTINLSFLEQLTGEELYTGCEGDGYSVTVNGTLYDESNSTGTETLTAATGCDSVVTINLSFLEQLTGEELYTGCEGDGYSVTVNGTLYDESNSTGTETLTASNGCDSVVTVNLTFQPNASGEELYTGCEGDGYSITVNGTLYDESNPTGTETLTASNGCDSVVTINLSFLEQLTGEELYTGCEGDGYSVTVNGTLYNESNPTGTETLTAANGCDSVVTVTLAFQPNAIGEVLYTGCEGDGYSVTVGGTLYDESNPTGTETLTAANGCDSVVTINLSFLEQLTGEELYIGCEGDGYSVTVNGTLYDESNPTGTETLTAANGCDSVVTINLSFLEQLTGEELYTGCEGDGYSVTVNGTLYDESNPTGTETLTAANGCDSVVTINLSFLEQLIGEELYTGCEGDGYSVTVNGTLYNESNPTGTEALTSATGCDSVVTVSLTFQPNASGQETYTGFPGDGYSVVVNGTVYNESNPTGTEVLTAANGCDSVVSVDLLFLPNYDFAVDDPCVCSFDFAPDGRRLFDEVVRIGGLGAGGTLLPLPAGMVWEVLDLIPTGADAPIGVNIGDIFEYNPVTGFYAISFQHIDNIGFELVAGSTVMVGGVPTPVEFTVSNVCSYDGEILVDVSGNGQFTAADCEEETFVVFSGNIIDCGLTAGLDPNDIAVQISLSGAALSVTEVQPGDGFAYFEATGVLGLGNYQVDVAYSGVEVEASFAVIGQGIVPATIIMPGNPVFAIPVCDDGFLGTVSILITDACGLPIDPGSASFTLAGNPVVPSQVDNGQFLLELPLNATNDGDMLSATYVNAAGQFSNATTTIRVNAQPDLFAPVIIHPSQNQTVTLDPCGPSVGEVDFNISAYDDCDGDITPVVTATGGTLSQDGNTWTLELAANTCEEVTITATDVAGNTRTESFQVCAEQAPRPVDDLVCEDNLFVTLEEDCERQLTAEMLLEGSFGCLTEDDFIIVIKSFSGQLLNSDGILPGTGEYIYDIQLAPGAPADATFEGCWGFVAGEDKTAPAIDCPPSTGTGTIVKNGYQISGEIEDTDPAIVIEDHSCLIDNAQGTPGLTGERFVDVQSFQVDRNDIYTFLVESDVTDLGNVGFAIYQGSYDIENPCENIIAQSDIPQPPSTGNPLPGAQPNDPYIRLSLPLQAGQTYFIATSTYSPGATGTYEYSICADGNGRAGFFDTTVIVNPDWTETAVVNFTPLPTAPVEIEVPLLCGDLDLILNNPASLAITGSPAAADNCGPVTTTFTDTYAQSGDCGDIIITRTFTATDATGRTATCEQLITLRKVEYSDIYLPPFTAPIECDEESYETLANGNPAPSATGYPFVFTASGIFDLSDDYCNVGASFEDGTRIDVCEGAYKFVRTWTIIDWCNPIEFFTYPQIIKVGDFTAPEVQCPAGAPLVYSASPFACAAAFEVPMPVVSDNCSSTSVLTDIVTIVEEEILTHWGSPTGEFTFDTIVVRTVQPGAGRFVSGIPVGGHLFRYTVTDACGNKAVVHCPFEVADQIAPVAVCDDELNVSIGGATVLGEALARITAADVDEGSWDNCELASIDISREITADCISTYAEQVNRMSWPADYRNIGSGSGFDEVFVSRVNVPERGIVIDQPLIGRKGGVLYSFWSGEAFFTCCDVGTELKIELRATDAAGNENICWLVTTPEDKLRPICVAPANVTIDCEELPLGFDVNDEGLLNDLFGTAEGLDNCSIETVEQTGASADLECRAGTIVRTFRVTDHGGLTADCSQTIIVNKSHNYEIKFPADAEAVCGAAAPDSVIYNEIGCDLLAVSHTDEVFQASGDECYKIFRTWRVINWCEYDGESPAIVLGRDENCSGTPGDDCFWLLRRPNGKVYIDKDTDETPGNNVPGFNPCNFQVRDFYRKFESDRGFWQYTQHIKVYDDIAPVITFDAPDPFCSLNNVDCDALVTLPFTVDEDCTPDDLEITVSLNAFLGGTLTPLTGVLSGTFPNYTISGRFPIGSHAFRVTVADGCGNSAAAVLPFMVIDCKAPTPICLNGLAIELMPVDLDGDNLPDACAGMAEVWASDFLASPNSDCTGPIKYSINLSGEANDPNNQGLFFDCEDEGSVVVEIWAYDAAGNGDFCETYVLVQDNMGVCSDCDPSPGIAGAVSTEPGQDEPVEDVEVSLSGQMSDMMITGSDGLYGFADLQAGMDYTVTPQRDGDYLNGVSTFDLVLISKHILGVQPLDSPYKRIAADANNSGAITTLDMIQLRKLILAIDLALSNNTSWRFVDAAYVFPDPTDPWLEVFPEVININDLPGAGIGNADFIAVKIGDVTGDARPNSFSAIDDRSIDKTFALFVAEDVAMQAGNEYSITFTAADLAGIEGYQATLTLGKAVELVDIVNGIAAEEHFGLSYAGEGMITTSWHGDAANGNLFTLVLRANADVQLSEVLGVSSAITKAEAYGKDGSYQDVAIVFGNGTAASLGFELYQNMPNPFKSETAIGFNLPEAGSATLTVSDVSGRVLKQYTIDAVKGYNELMLRKGSLPNGLLQYTLRAGEHTATKRMVVMEE